MINALKKPLVLYALSIFWQISLLSSEKQCNTYVINHRWKIIRLEIHFIKISQHYNDIYVFLYERFLVKNANIITYFILLNTFYTFSSYMKEIKEVINCPSLQNLYFFY